MPDGVTSTVSGIKARVYTRGSTIGTDPSDQYVIPTEDRIVSFRGRANSVRIFGIAGTAGQKLASIFNASGSAVLVDVEGIYVDVMQTAARVVEPPVIRVHRVTAAPTGGTAMSKVAEDSAQSSSASVTLLQAASNETGTATAVVSTLATTTVVTQEWGPRALTLVGYEQYDRAEFLVDSHLTLRASEGLVVNLDYSVATANPVTDKWVATIKWIEYTRP